MNNNNNFSVLPFYADINEQYSRLPYSYGARYPLYTPLGEFLPFQLQVQHRASQPITAYLFNEAGVAVSGNLATALANNGMQVVQFADYGEDVVVYASATSISGDLGFTPKEGRYYLRINVGGDTFYSEIFTWVQSVDSMLRIQWYDEKNLISDSGIIVYEDPRFINNLYLCTEVGKPEYQFTEEGETRDGYFFPEKQLSEKTYKATILAPEYLCDVMRLIRMADHIRVTDTYGRVYDCDTFQIEVKWEEQGDLASVVMQWETDTVIKRVGVAYVRRQAGDYNIDYNEDYNNQQ